jgi:LuxR family maltose regulon positive regulatory protein
MRAMIVLAPRSTIAAPIRAVPRLPEPWLRRPRLLTPITRAAGGQTFLVAALAGSGKTTLLADWFAHEREIAGGWVSLERPDNERGRLAERLASALGCRPEVTASSRTSDVTVLERLFDELESRGTRSVVVLDDVHELRSRNAIDTLSHLIRFAPPSLTVILATRADPPVPLHRLRLDGRLGQLRTSDLALTTEETAALLHRYAVHLDDASVALLCEHLGGWAGGMRLVAAALTARPDARAFVDEIVQSQSVLSDFLLGEAFEWQPPVLQQFLLRACAARTLTVDLARELTGDAHAAHHLAALEQMGIVSARDDGHATEYQFHALFGTLLRARLRRQEPALAEQLGARAARWYLERDRVHDAETHAFDAGDWALGGALACRRWVETTLREPLAPVDVDAPPDACRDVGDLAVLMTASAVAKGDERAAGLWRSRTDAIGPSAHETPWSRAGRLLADVLYARAFGSDSRSRLAVRDLLDSDLGPDTAALHAVVRYREAELLLDTDNCSDAVAVLGDARWRAARAGVSWVVDAADATLAFVVALRGDLADAERLLAAIPAYEDDGTSDLNDLRALTKAVVGAQRSRASVREVLGRKFDAPLSHAMRTAADEARCCAAVTPPSAARPLTHPMAIAVRTAFGVLDVGAMPDAETDLAYARDCLRRGRNDEVVTRLERVAEAEATDIHPRTRIEAIALVAVAADRLDDGDRALASLARAVSLAERDDLRAPLVALGDDLTSLLARYAWTLGANGAYAAEIADATRDGAPAFLEPLTERERAVLGYLPTLMSNAEIAARLLMSVNTVKTHLKSVYRKLGVDRRRDAVARARQFDLL